MSPKISFVLLTQAEVCKRGVHGSCLDKEVCITASALLR